MAKIVVLSSQGIEPAVGRYDFLIQGDPSVLGLTAAVGSLAVQTDSAVPFAQWQKLTTSDTGWTLVSQSANAGASSASGSYRASAYAIPVDGATDAVAALATLTGTTMPQTGGPYAVIVGPSESVKTASDVTLPATVQLQSTGGTFKPASGKKLVLNAQPSGSGKMFDTSLGGVVTSGRALTANPLWWGADPTGAAGSHTALNSAWGFLAADPVAGDGVPTGTWGGRLYIPSGTYKMDAYGLAYGASYGNTLVHGDGPSTVLQTVSGRVQGVAPEWEGVITVYGGGTFTTPRIAFRDMLFKGAGTSDATTFMILDQCEEIVLENLYFQDNAIECVRSLSGTQVRKVNVHNCHGKNVGKGSRGAAFMNIGAQQTTMTDCTVENSSIGVETGNSFTTIANCRFKDMTQWGIMLYSTWSGWLDPDAFTQVNAYAGTITNCQFISIPDRAILIPDYTGHANADGAHPSPAHLDGNLGQIQIMGNLFDRIGTGVWGGADKAGAVDCYGNLFSGQYDAGTGPQTYAFAPEGGTWNFYNNTFQLGQGIQWTGLMGNFIGRSGGPTRVRLTDNSVYNLCWNGSPAFGLYKDDSIKGTRFFDLDGTIAAASNPVLYQFSDTAGTVTAQLRRDDWAWYDPEHQVSMAKEPTKLPVLGDTLPPFMQFKPGDQLVNRGSTATWFSKKCKTGGTTNPTPLTCTGAATSGTKTLVVSSATGLGVYSWISVPSVPTVTNKQILAISGTTITVDVNFETTVTGGTALAWATPTFVTDRDITTLSVASQATGDLMYASSATAWTRLGKGADGTYLGFSGGIPATLDSFVRYDAGNSATAMTVTRTPARQEQKFTLTTATPVITIDDTAIPSGAYLVTDAFQDATGTRIPTWALTSAGTINWVGGSAPTLTTTASKADRIVWHNEGSRITAWLALQNF